MIAADAANATCAPENLTVRTDESGAFAFERVSERRFVSWVSLLPYHEIFNLTVCLRDGEVYRPIYRVSDYTLVADGIGPLPTVIKLNCTLGSDWGLQPPEQLSRHCTARENGGARNRSG